MNIYRNNTVAVLGTAILFLFCAPMQASDSEHSENTELEEKEKSTTYVVPLARFPAPKPTPEQEYVQSVRRAVGLCQQSGGLPAECWSKASPAKCDSLVYAALVEKGDKFIQWHLCASTCTDAGYWSRTFGECRTELAPVADSDSN